MTTRFAKGDVITWRIIWFGRVWWALPVTVVKDSDTIALYVAPGTPYKAGGVGENPGLPPTWQLTDRIWDDHPVLQLSHAGEAHSIWAIWASEGGELAAWYVNLQEPLRRTTIGFDTRDNMLDVVVEPDLTTWSWKDEADLDDGVRTGLLSAAKAGEVRREGERVIDLIEAGKPPFDPRWASWLPAFGPAAPELCPGWEVGARSFGEPD
jgi:hypothetical protein